MRGLVCVCACLCVCVFCFDGNGRFSRAMLWSTTHWTLRGVAQRDSYDESFAAAPLVAQVSPRTRGRKLVASSIQATAWARRGHLAPAIAAIVSPVVRSRWLYPFLEEVWPAALGGPGTACCYWILSGCRAWATSGKNCVLFVFDDSCDIQPNRCTVRNFASSIS